MVDYLYYKKTYQGIVINEKEDFERCEKLAVLYIKSVIAKNSQYDEEELWDCVCAVAEQIYENKDTKNIKSETVDGYSVTYTGDFNKYLYEILKIYLPPELLYRGI